MRAVCVGACRPAAGIRSCNPAFFSFVSWRYFGLGFGVGVPVAGESAAQREVTWDGSVESRFAQYIVKNSERAPFS